MAIPRGFTISGVIRKGVSDKDNGRQGLRRGHNWTRSTLVRAWMITWVSVSIARGGREGKHRDEEHRVTVNSR